jgi:hypothetical protein
MNKESIGSRNSPNSRNIVFERYRNSPVKSAIKPGEKEPL